MAQAIWQFQRACMERPPNVRYRAMPSLARRHLDPALHACISAPSGPESAYKSDLTAFRISARLKDPVRLDRDLCRLNAISGGLISETIDTLRETMRWIARHRPARAVPQSLTHLRGESRRSTRTTDHSAYATWPFCEHCCAPSQRAERLLEQKQLADSLESPRFCLLHDPTVKGSMHRTALRHKPRFEALVKAIEEELRSDARFRARFIDVAWGSTPVPSPNEIQELLMKSSEEIHPDPIEELIRSYAFEISRQPPDPLLLHIARLSNDGVRPAQIALTLRVSRQAISQRMRNSRGFFDFGRKSPLLYWWPDDRVTLEAFSLQRGGIS